MIKVFNPEYYKEKENAMNNPVRQNFENLRESSKYFRPASASGKVEIRNFIEKEDSTSLKVKNICLFFNYFKTDFIITIIFFRLISL